MPSNVVHNYFAKCVIKDLSSEIINIINQNEEAYLIGAQGPDLLFYLRYEEEPLPKLGRKVHRSFEVHRIFKDSGNYVKELDNKSLFAFLLGQLCHYVLDANVHPYVYHRELDLPKHYTKGAHKNIHVVFESGIDYLYIRDYLKVNTKFYKGYKNINCSSSLRAEIAKYYSNVVAPAFDMSLPVELGEKMILLMREFMRICDDVTGLRYLIIRGVEKITGAQRNISAFIRPRKENKEEDWLNENRTPYPKYKNETEMINKTFIEMVETARVEAIELINNFYNFVIFNEDLNESLYYRNYSGERRIRSNHK